MWNKRNEEPSTPSYAPATPARVEPAPPPPPAPRAVAAIGSSMRIKGEIHSREELFVDGEVEGVLHSQSSLTIGPNGKIQANIKAREVTILGSVKGNIEAAEKITIRQSGSLIGDIKTAGISIDDGAYFKGSIDIVRPEPSRQPKPPVVNEPVVAAR
jgi:cytoskeletal protein CcmA (bactofilin family)